MTHKPLDDCLAITRRNYPDGYGFVIGYLRYPSAPDAFRTMEEAAWRAVEPLAMVGNPDAAAFVNAFAASRDCRPVKGWQWWLVEAAQLVHADALSGNRKACAVMAQWNHPGYPEGVGQ